MKPIKGKIIVKITKAQWNDLFVKKIKRDDGTYCDLVINMEAGDDDDRRFTLNVQSGEVVAVADGLEDILVGDIAILDYVVSNDDANNLIEDNDEYEIRSLKAFTTYHEKDEVVYANRRSPKDQVIAKRGDYDEISQILGIIRKNELIALKPYIFLEHISNVISMVSASGILHEETKMIYERKVLAASSESLMRPLIKPGDVVVVRDFDVFTAKIGEKKIDVIFEKDVLIQKSLI